VVDEIHRIVDCRTPGGRIVKQTNNGTVPPICDQPGQSRFPGLAGTVHQYHPGVAKSFVN
jgi:hypothetical protein